MRDRILHTSGHEGPGTSSVLRRPASAASALKKPASDAASTSSAPRAPEAPQPEDEAIVLANERMSDWFADDTFPESEFRF